MPSSYEKVYAMPFAKVHPLLVSKAVKKGRTAAEVDQVTSWLTGYSPEQIALNPARELVTGVVCGVRVEAIEEPLMRDIRRLDKLVDELAKGKPMEKILRKP